MALTDFMRQLVAEHSDGSGNAAGERRGEGGPYGHAIHEDVHCFAEQDHSAEGGLATWYLGHQITGY